MFYGRSWLWFMRAEIKVMADWAVAVRWDDLQQDPRGKEWSQPPPWLPLLRVLLLVCDAHTKAPMQTVGWRPQSPHSSGLGPREAQLARMRGEHCGSLFYLRLGGLSLCPVPPPREPCIWLFSSKGLRASSSGNHGILVFFHGCDQAPCQRKVR